MGKACSMCGKAKKCVPGFTQKTWGQDTIWKGSVQLKYSIKMELDWNDETKLIWTKTGTSGGILWISKQIFVAYNARNFLTN